MIKLRKIWKLRLASWVIQFIRTDKERPTSLKTRYRAGGQQILRVDDEITTDIDDKNANHILKLATAVSEDADLMVISDYGKGTFAASEQIIATARQRNTLSLTQNERMCQPMQMLIFSRRIDRIKPSPAYQQH